MGIIKAFSGAVAGTLADAWHEVIEPYQMSDTTVFTKGQIVRKKDKRSSNTKGTADTITNGSIIHVYDNQFMLLVDGGRIVDYSAEPGYYKVEDKAMPSLFNGELDQVIVESFNRFKFGGVPSASQKVFYINLQEIKGIRFGTRTPINYFDVFYNSELFLRTHGTYSIRITDPIKFYQEAVPRNQDHVDISDINEQYLHEFLNALQTAINQMSADGIRVSHVASKGRELSKYMSTTLDEEWRQTRGMEIQSVGIGSISYDEESEKLIKLRNQGAMLSDPSIREGYVQGAMARGIESAGANQSGAANSFMGVGLGMQAGGNVAASFSQSNQAQMSAQQKSAEDVQQWHCRCGASNNGNANFCSQCGAAKPIVGGWQCACGNTNPEQNLFCPKCGKPKLVAKTCSQCGQHIENNEAQFCPKCGANLS